MGQRWMRLWERGNGLAKRRERYRERKEKRKRERESENGGLREMGKNIP